jgi:hypothetical protein
VVPARGREVLRTAEPGAALVQACLFPGLEEEIVVYQAQRLAEKIVRRSVAAGIAGAYYLKEVLPRGGVREAVGRDDHDLRKALLSRCGGSVENVLFGWTIARTAFEAYRHECFLWHIKGGAFGRLTTPAHPAAPSEGWAGCPECGDDGGRPPSFLPERDTELLSDRHAGDA